MRLIPSKSSLKSQLQVEIPWLSNSCFDAVILDGCALLWVVSWLATETVEDFVLKFISTLNSYLISSDTFLVFDRYNNNSIKSATRISRMGNVVPQRYTLSLYMPLPSQKSILSVTKNKVQLIQILCMYINDHLSDIRSSKTLVVTGPDPVPFEIAKGVVINRGDLINHHEEAE